MFNYKGYVGRIDYDDEVGTFHGEVINTRDVITFQGKSVNELKKALRESVEDYLEFCRERGEEPDRPFSGKFVVRVPPEVHREAFLKAKSEGKSLNAWVREAIEKTGER
ncbi:type II toxin-antitoxin system HicB family antitoxin [bacterium]|nr:type II toxin-antitoxin system HicB family antitoxin [bacterium]